MKTQSLTSKRISVDRLISLSVLFWSAVALIGTTKASFYYTLKGIPTYWPHLSINHIADGVIWILLTPLMYHLILWLSKFRFSIILTGVSGIPLSICQSILALTLDEVLRWNLGFISTEDILGFTNDQSYLLSRTFNSLTYYMIIAGLIYLIVNYSLRSVAEEVKHERVTTGPGNSSKLFFNQKGMFSSFNLNKLNLIKAEGNYIRIYDSDQSSLVRQSIGNLEKRLDPHYFYRLSRSFIVNKDFIVELKHHRNGEYVVTLQNGQTFNTTRTYREHVVRLKEYLKKISCN